MYICVPDPEVVGRIDPSTVPEGLAPRFEKFEFDLTADTPEPELPKIDGAFINPYGGLAAQYARNIDPIWRGRFDVAPDVPAKHHVDLHIGTDEQVVAAGRIIAKGILRQFLGTEITFPWGRAGIPHKDLSVAEITPSTATYLTSINRRGTQIFTGTNIDFTVDDIYKDARISKQVARSALWFFTYVSRVNRLGVSTKRMFQGDEGEVIEMHPLTMHRNPRVQYIRGVTPIIMRDIVSIKPSDTKD